MLKIGFFCLGEYTSNILDKCRYTEWNIWRIITSTQPKIVKLGINFSNWNHCVKQVYLGLNQKKSPQCWRITWLSTRVKERESMYWFRLCPMFVHNLGSVLYHLNFTIYESTLTYCLTRQKKTFFFLLFYLLRTWTEHTLGVPIFKEW